MARTRLGRGKDIVTLQDGRNAVGLDRRARLVAAQLHVLEHDRMQAGVLELGESSVSETEGEITEGGNMTDPHDRRDTGLALLGNANAGQPIMTPSAR